MDKFVFILKSVVLNSVAGGIIGSLFGLVYYADTAVHPHMPFPYWFISGILLLSAAFAASLVTSVILVLANKLKLGVVIITSAAIILFVAVVFLTINN